TTPSTTALEVGSWWELRCPGAGGRCWRLFGSTRGKSAPSSTGLAPPATIPSARGSSGYVLSGSDVPSTSTHGSPGTLTVMVARTTGKEASGERPSTDGGCPGGVGRRSHSPSLLGCPSDGGDPCGGVPDLLSSGSQAWGGGSFRGVFGRMYHYRRDAGDRLAR
ncbi:MAG TPA: hypothetical protein VF303_00005, partial [Candidatus Nanoarchaeia archaeon]